MHRRTHHEEKPFRQIDGLQRFTNTFRESIVPEDKKRHIGAEFQRQILQRFSRQIHAPQAIQGEQRGRGVRAAAAKTGAHGQYFINFYVYAKGAARCRLQQTRSTYNKVMRFRHARHIGFTCDDAVVATGEVQQVAPVEQLEHRLQRVIAIWPTARNVQKQIELGRREAIAQGRIGQRAR